MDHYLEHPWNVVSGVAGQRGGAGTLLCCGGASEQWGRRRLADNGKEEQK